MNILMKNNLLTMMAAALVCASCAKEMQEVGTIAPEQQNLMTKLVGGAQGELIPGQVLIQMSKNLPNPAIGEVFSAKKKSFLVNTVLSLKREFTKIYRVRYTAWER